MCARNGFSLLEVGIATALGLLLVSVAMSGFQVALGAMGRTARLAKENEVLRAGFFLALDRIDTWPAADPEDQTIPNSDLIGSGSDLPQLEVRIHREILQAPRQHFHSQALVETFDPESGAGLRLDLNALGSTTEITP